jgi:hypothetical protein
MRRAIVSFETGILSSNFKDLSPNTQLTIPLAAAKMNLQQYCMICRSALFCMPQEKRPVNMYSDLVGTVFVNFFFEGPNSFFQQKTLKACLRTADVLSSNVFAAMASSSYLRELLSILHTAALGIETLLCM